ncbi:MAG TPA: alkaline phosphatase family protein [Candidatus Cybelea sp.]|jgi:phospholipase C
MRGIRVVFIVMAALVLTASFANTPPAPQAGLSQIDHIVIIVQENRSFDNLFHGFPGAHSVSTGKLPNGKTTELKPVSLAAFYDISHGLQDAKTAYDSGKMDGFANEYSNGQGSGDPYPQYKYVSKSEITPYWDMAQQYVLSDRMFSQLDGSFVAHQFLIAGWAGRTYNHPADAPWGCDGPSGNVIGVLNVAGQPYGEETPCFTYSTIAGGLDSKGVSWRYYSPKTGDGYLWNAFDAIAKIRNGPDWQKHMSFPETKILNDVANGQLAGVTWVIPSNALSDHPGSKSKRGPSWVASVVNAIGKSKFWSSTAIFVIWDDWGGWYDDVSPQQQGFDGLGMRVPLLCISPFAKPGYVDHTPYRFGSILKFVEQRFDLPALGRSDSGAAAPLNCFDFKKKPSAFRPILAPYDVRDVEAHATNTAPDDE